MNQTNNTSLETTNKTFTTQKLLVFAGVSLIILVILIIVVIIFKRVYQKFRRRKKEALVKHKKAEVKSIYDDKFGIIENEGGHIRDKSMIKEFLENNMDLKKKDDSFFKKDDKNFNYICAKNVFNIEGEESEYHYDSKRASNRQNSNDSAENDEELGQFSQDIDQSNVINEETNEKKNDNSILNALN